MHARAGTWSLEDRAGIRESQSSRQGHARPLSPSPALRQKLPLGPWHNPLRQSSRPVPWLHATLSALLTLPVQPRAAFPSCLFWWLIDHWPAKSGLRIPASPYSRQMPLLVEGNKYRWLNVGDSCTATLSQRCPSTPDRSKSYRTDVAITLPSPCYTYSLCENPL
ncbi:hypothetical protein F4861DRAFT_8499 [Xylaria intraflava]|nr:hypothetical protein F4861DRAFT_8499 [Xylaria intraflava]